MSKIGFWIDNLMDRVKVGDHLKKNGFEIENIPDLEGCLQFLQTGSSIAIVDLQNASLDFETMQQRFAVLPELSTRIVAYFPHVQIHLKKGAEQCGVAHIYPRSVFFGDPIALIQKVVKESKG